MRNLLTKKLLLMSFGFVRRVAGYPVKLLKSLGKPLKQYKVYGNSIQQCKNFLYTSKTTQELNGVTFTNENGTITLNGTCTTSSNFELGNLVLYPGVYTLSTNATVVPVENSYALLQAYDSTNNKNIVVNNKDALKPTINNVSVKGTFAYRIRIEKDTVYDNFIMKPQLELGTVQTDFEPHYEVSPTTPIEVENFGDKIPSELFTEVGATNGYLRADGTIVTPHVNLYYTDYIQTYGSTVITQTYIGEAMNLPSMCFYTKDKTFISGMAFEGAKTKAFTVPTNAYYFRTCYRTTFTANSITSDNTGKYKIPIKVESKNLFNLNAVEHTERTEILENGIKWLQSGDVDIKLPTGKYTISFKQSGTGSLYLRNGKVGSGYIATIDATATYKTFIFNASVDGYLRISCFATGKILTDIQIEEGDMATTYEQYQQPITTNIYLDEPLRRIGDYADYIDFKNGKVVRNIFSRNLQANNVSGIGSKDDTMSLFNLSGLSNRLILNISDNIQVLSNKLKALSYSDYTKADSKSINSITGNVGNSALFFKIKNELTGVTNDMTNAEKITKCNEYLTANSVIVYYILATPTEETIDLPKVQTVKNTAIITTDTNIPAWCISCEYLSKKKDNNTAYLKSSQVQYIDIGFKPNQDTSVEAKCLSTSTNTQFLWGARDSNLNNTFTTIFSTSNHARFDYNTTGGSYVNFAPTLNKTYVYYQNKNKGIIDNVLFKTWTYADFQSDYNLHLFTVNQANAGNPNKFIGNIYYCKVWDNDVLIRDMIPVTDYQSIPSMWDFETEKYYYNKGTGADFIYGNEEE